MKKFLALCICLILMGCSSNYNPNNPPLIDCGGGNKIVVQETKLLFSPPLSGDIEPLIAGQCKAFLPEGGVIEIERFDLVMRFSEGEIISLPREDFGNGFNFRWIP